MPICHSYKKLSGSITEPLKTLLEQAAVLDKWPIAKLISIFESDSEQGLRDRHQLISYLQSTPELYQPSALIIGVTGAPGVGKSSLVGELCLNILEQQPEASIAVLAVDPSSHDSGGALLGDRTRSLFPHDEKRLFFRSQASALDYGGLSCQSYQVTRLLQYFFEFIVIETVGIGQNEIEVQQLCDHSFLVMQPFAGDQVQFIKAGIMEIPDSFIINKCDEVKHAERSCHQLETSLSYTKNKSLINGESVLPKIFMTSAVNGQGVSDVASFILSLKNTGGNEARFASRDNYFLGKWVQQLYGLYGYKIFQNQLMEKKFNDSTYEKKQREFERYIETKLML